MSLSPFRRRATLLLGGLRPPPVVPRPSRQVQVRALLAVLEEAVAVQRPADAAVAACGEPGPVPGQVARDCGDAASALLHVRARLRELTLTEPDLVEARAYAGRLLDYGQWMVHQSANLAFTVRRDARTEAARCQLNGLGRPADDLRRLRDTLTAREGRP
ncbi:hypothetical protein [Streptomyces antibioticus]|uniref:hypothetical protein n=1 Tax=Streptomyces antibioticus TaxID=1890 RepID=UPI00225B7CAD|nr:hypothetical protein [Streptomyces antibioticus]MCX4742894.1 hypothetical protein [Streptomyces antibioticus]